MYTDTDTSSTSITNDNRIVLTKAGELMNTLVHKEITKIQSNSNAEDPLYFNIDEAIEKIDPLLHQFLNVSTRSKRELHSSKLAPRSETGNHTKKYGSISF